MRYHVAVALALSLGAQAQEAPLATFTPQIEPIPDIVIGDQTPKTGFSPDESLSPEDTMEGIPATAEIFEFPNAFNLFDLVQDVGSGGQQGESDETLQYELISSPVFFATAGNPGEDGPLSVNGERISTSALTDISAALAAASGEVSLRNEAATGMNFTGAPSFSGEWTYMFGPSHYHPTYGGPFVGDVTRDIIDGNVLTLIVSNSVATSVMTDFMVVTVNDGPDATRFSLVQDSQILDLSVWEFSPGLSNAFGTFPGDVIVFGRVPDLNNDGSIDDLFISAPSPGGQSFVIWGSPPDTVPFTDDATYRLRWLVSNEGFESPLAEAPDQRFRVSYGFQGGLGSIVHVAEGIIAPPPASGETMYTMLFEELEVASANATTVLDSTIGPFGGLTSTENSKRLFWDWIDLNKRGRMADQVGGGMLTLKSVVVERISSSALLAGAITELDVSNFMQGVEIDRFGGNVNLSSADIAIAYASDEVSVSSVGQTSPLSPPYRLFGVISLALDVDGIATLPFVPTDPAADRLYRAEFRIEAAGNGAPVPQIRLSINSFHEERLVNGLATSLILNAVRNGPEANEAGVTGDPNPALEAQTYSTYLALPSTASLDPNSRVGDRIQASVCLIDQDDPYVSEGAIRVTGIRIDSIPMDALP